MYDVDTFVTVLYVTVDDVIKTQPAAASRPGPAAALCPSEVIPLALFVNGASLPASALFIATHCATCARPFLPCQTAVSSIGGSRTHHDAIVAFALVLGQQVSLPSAGYEVLDSMGVPVRNAKRRGRGWLAGQAALGWCNRVGSLHGPQTAHGGHSGGRDHRVWLGARQPWGSPLGPNAARCTAAARAALAHCWALAG
jgi:hypothetical protein